MERLWAPWRMAYVAGGEPAAGECILCAFPLRDWREHLVLTVTERAFVLMNKFPYNNGHVMVVPRRHVADPEDLDGDEYHAAQELVRTATRVLRDALTPHGFNVGMNLGRVAGAGIAEHCHWHIVPRWNGDTNFMPVLADVKVMPEHLSDGYDRLRPLFAPLDGKPERAGQP